MSRPARPLCAILWSPDLVDEFGRTMASIGRLDARISASSVAPAWMLRASWTGYATALRLQRHEIDEIDVISHFTGVRSRAAPPLSPRAIRSALTPIGPQSWQPVTTVIGARTYPLPSTFPMAGATPLPSPAPGHGRGEGRRQARPGARAKSWQKRPSSCAPWSTRGAIERTMLELATQPSSALRVAWPARPDG